MKKYINKMINSKKSFNGGLFILGVVISILTQLLHCIIFYYCRTLFMHIIEGNRVNLFFDIQKYIFMFFTLGVYSLIINYYHRKVITAFIKKEKIALLLEDILLSWKYFLVLLVFLYKIFVIAHWALAVYLLVINILIRYNKKIVKFTVFLTLFIIHIFLYFYSYHQYISLIMLSYSAIYLAILPCLNTVKRLKVLLKIT